MNGGPTVRRIHRVRDAAIAAAHYQRLMRGPMARAIDANRRRPVAAATARPGQAAREQAVAARRATRLESCFPITVADVFGLTAGQDALVAEGSLHTSANGPAVLEGTRALSWRGSKRSMIPQGRLDTLLRAHMQSHLPSLLQWSAEEVGQPCDLDQLSGFKPAVAASSIDTFVHERLIPCLEEVAGCVLKEQVAQADMADDAGDVPGMPLPAWESRFAFLSDRWLSLVPFAGSPGNRDTLVIDGQLMLVLEALPANMAVSRYDNQLRLAVRESMSGVSGPSARTAIYRIGGYAVHRTPRGRYFVSQYQPPYVIEAQDGRLFYFGGAEVGIEVNALKASAVVHSQSARVLHPYPHMFVFGGGFICMPRPQEYFAELSKRPLEEALLLHLEGARLTLCAGYLPQSVGVHPVEGTGRPVLHKGEVKRRRLPVYRYNKGHDRAVRQV